MPMLSLSNQQVIELVQQLPAIQQVELFRFLLHQQWGEWESLSQYGHHQAKFVAQERGYQWGNMTEDERESFIDDLVHED
jgi:hypothetical protein